MHYRYYTADVFTDRIFNGNQLAVFPEAHGLEHEQMQRVAQEFNIAETVFVFPPEDAKHTRRLRIFTPGTELPFAGHPTIGTAYVLASIGEIVLDAEPTHIVFEEGVGPVSVSIEVIGATPRSVTLIAPRLPEFGPEPPHATDIASVLSLDESDLLVDDNAPQAVSCGVPFLFVPLRSRDAVTRARVKRDTWEQILSSFWAPSLYVFSYDPELDGSDIHARMFAPLLGIDEDPATGAAVTALAGYLGVRDKSGSGRIRWVVEQGIEMGRPSILEVVAVKQNSKITEIQLVGSAVLVSEGEMEIPALSDLK